MNEQDFTKDLSRATKKLSLGVRTNYANIILWLAVVLIVAVGLVSVQEFDLKYSLRALSEFIVVLVLYYCVLFSRSEIGRRDGFQDDDYLKEKSEYDKAFDELSKTGNLHKLSEYCSYFVHSELIEMRTAILDDVDIEYNAVFGDGQLPEDLSLFQRKAIAKAKRLKPLHLTRSMLLNIGNGKYDRHALGVNPETKRKIQMGLSVVRAFATLMVAVNFTVKIVEQPTVETFIRIAYQVLCLLLVAWRGYSISFTNVTVDRANRIHKQTEHLRAATGYLASREESKQGRGDSPSLNEAPLLE